MRTCTACGLSNFRRKAAPACLRLFELPAESGQAAPAALRASGEKWTYTACDLSNFRLKVVRPHLRLSDLPRKLLRCVYELPDGKRF